MKLQTTTVFLRVVTIISSVSCFSTTIVETVKQKFGFFDKKTIQ